ncbi:methyltransferase family protein [Actinocorallia herbida]|uniref:Methyltransferase family protein n=1 Tax=Actinocorallia herbida TaxID=58109 RepID=A0A3N1CY84_9ACTN|nr:class I SAM-dependent methyltransferase [Actinocorallia herbida]ROO86215.1 methyltransferase family protein [Actinocorallia herbida]
MENHHEHHTHHRSQEHGHGHGHGHDGEGEETALLEILDLDAEVFSDLMDEATSLIAEAAGDTPPQQVLDLGAGTGAGTFALLRRFPEASAVAVDGSARHLKHLRERAVALGLLGRISPSLTDLDGAWPDFDRPDLVWASNSLHHFADPARVLRDIGALLAPGGLLAVLEMPGFPTFLQDDTVPLGLEARVAEALAAENAAHLPHRAADWTALLTEAGFTIETHRVLESDLPSPVTPEARRYAHLSLDRLYTRLASRLTPTDRTAMDDLATEGAAHLPLHLRTARTLWLARPTAFTQ